MQDLQQDSDAPRWLVLVYQFPSGPDSRRMKVWRRLQSIGAVAIKNSVYVLPLNEQAREDFQWLLAELHAAGAEGAILEARFVDGMSDQQVRELARAARSADYQALQEELTAALPDDTGGDGDAAEPAPRTLVRARKRLAEIETIDFFGAEGHDQAEAALRKLAARIAQPPAHTQRGDRDMAATRLDKLQDRVCVTRRGVRVDRIASAWLVRRWIDPSARFKFVAGQAYAAAPGELRFDMYEAEFTHQGDRCTFEVLAEQVRGDDPALRKVGEIVHDIDLKDGRHGHPETAGVSSLLDGIINATEVDELRIERGSALFENLYRGFGGSGS